ncbi:MAG: SDR family NAD(P)-dependent oxidoreductase [Caldilineaceae bacterium]
MSILERFSLVGRTALVTGAARGIGQSLATALAEAGADVAVVDVNMALAETTAKEIQDLGVNTLALRVDVTDAEQVKQMVTNVVRPGATRYRRTAGIARRSPSEEIEEAEWDAILDVNLKGVFLCSQAAGRVMLAQKRGSIINVASMSGQIVNRPQRHAHYNASKAGVVQVTRTLAAEWAPHGVRLNTISPGHTHDPDDGSRRRRRPLPDFQHPNGRSRQPSDLQVPSSTPGFGRIELRHRAMIW